MSWSVADFNPTEDWSLWDGVEEIDYYAFSPDTDSYAETPDSVSALCRELAYQTVTLSNGETTAVDLAFHLPHGDLAYAPRRLDKIIRVEQDSSGIGNVNRIYIVQAVRRSTLGTRWRLDCSRQKEAAE